MSSFIDRDLQKVDANLDDVESVGVVVPKDHPLYRIGILNCDVDEFLIVLLSHPCEVWGSLKY